MMLDGLNGKIYTSLTFASQLQLNNHNNLASTLKRKMKVITRRLIAYPFCRTTQATPINEQRTVNQNDNIKHKNFVARPSPRFISERIKYFCQIKARNEETLSSVFKPQITIILKNGKKVKGKAFETTPYQLTKMMPREIGENSLVAKVTYSRKYENPLSFGLSSTEPEEHSILQHHNAGYEIIQMNRPIEGDCTIELVSFDQKIGKEVFWHSSAHLLGQALQNLYGAWLCHGPPLQPGFFYDSFMGSYTMSNQDYDKIQQQIKQFTREKQVFERALLSKKEALDLFSYNPFKTELINSKIPDGGMTTVYRCGDLVDLCTGPHIPSSDKVRGFKVTKNSSAYWHGQKDKDQLQRVYGIAFPKLSQLEEYVRHQEQLAKKDHRNIGTNQELFSFSTLTPGSPFFHHHGTIIHNRLTDLLRSQYRIRGYQEVITPNIFHSELWKISGHYYKYKEHIYFTKDGTTQDEEHGLKPMNCPGHCLMFGLNQKSYKDLPIRMADFGVLHRNELHGALTGLTRVRRFQQDDAHIFCRYDQILDQILGVLDLLDYAYSVFGFKYTLELSTRPDKYLGSLEEWNNAQRQLKEALDKFGKDYKINEGDGAFYGPKIDVKLTDIFQREHQCGTVQLDFQLPIRFDLQYKGKDTHKPQEQFHHEHETPPTPSHHHSKAFQKSEPELHGQQKYGREKPLRQGFARPVIIHRAIFGSLERFIAILCEHTGGKWDFWMSPRQVKLITIGKEPEDYAKQVYNTLLLKGYSVELDARNQILNKKVRTAQMQGFNYIGVIGREQAQSLTVNLRKRDQVKEMGRLSLSAMLNLFESHKPPQSKLRAQLQQNSL